MKILILGVTGMLGNSLFRFLQQEKSFLIYGTARNENARTYFKHPENIIFGIEAENSDTLLNIFAKIKPQIVINCIGLVKQLSTVNDPLQAIPLNSLLPHQLAKLCTAANARFIHISTDCVFSGKKGNYIESDFPDAYDLYGRSKLLGEVDYPNSITLRTSIIGHELSGQRSLINWFLAQNGSVKGYTHAIYSGLPTVELARIIKEYVLPHNEMRGVYHVAANSINKFDLLKIVAKIYKKNIEIIPSNELVIDRSLNAERFNNATGYKAPEWEELISLMYNFN